MAFLDAPPLGRTCCKREVHHLPWTHPSLPPPSRQIPSLRISAKARLADDQERKREATSDKKFGIRIPRLSDVESGRQVLESAFHALSFDMPKLTLESPFLQILPFGIPRLSIPKQVLVFDLSFVVPKLKKPVQEEEKQCEPHLGMFDETRFPRCAWPRVSTGAKSGQGSEGTGSESHRFHPYPHCKWPRESLQRSSKPRDELVVHSLTSPVETQLTTEQHAMDAVTGSQCDSVLRAMETTTNTAECPNLTGSKELYMSGGRTLHMNGSAPAFYPRSPWPRTKVSTASPSSRNLITADASQQTAASLSAPGDATSSIIQGGPRSVWPRKTIPSRQGPSSKENAKSSDDLRSQAADENVLENTAIPTEDAAAALPRRLLATNVGLFVMNQFARRKLESTSSIDFLQAGCLDFAEDDEGTAFNLGRQTPVVILRS